MTRAGNVRILVSLLALIAAACTAPVGALVATGPTDTPATSVPISRVVAAVSRSSPSPEAAAALATCGISNFDASVSEGDTAKVSAMGLVSPASDASLYAPLGNAIELRTTTPAWVIVTSGWRITAPNGERLKDSTCVVLEDQMDVPIWYVTGAADNGHGIETPAPQPQPVRVLPSLAP